MTERRASHLLRSHGWRIAWLAVVWVALWGDLSWANVLAGIALGIVVSIVFPLPHVDEGSRVRPVALLVGVLRTAVDIVVASVQVAWLAVRPGPPPRSSMVAVPLHTTSDLYLALVAEIMSLIPGSLLVEVRRETGTLYVHALDVVTDEDVERFRRRMTDLELRVLRALAPREQWHAARDAGRAGASA